MWTVVLLAVVAAAVALLLVPIDLFVGVKRQPHVRVTVGFDWLFFHFRRELVPDAWRKKRREKKKEKKASGRRTRVPMRTVIATLRVPGLGRNIRRFLMRLVRSFRVRVDADLRVGLEDPADTGRLWVLIAPATAVCNRFHWMDLRTEPDFAAAGLTGRMDGTFRLYPSRLTYCVGSLIFSATTIRVVLAVVRSQPWKRKGSKES